MSKTIQNPFVLAATCNKEMSQLFLSDMKPVSADSDYYIKGRAIEKPLLRGRIDIADTWERREDLDWVSKVKREVDDFIEDSDGAEFVYEEFLGYIYSDLFIKYDLTTIVKNWVMGLPLSMSFQLSMDIHNKMKKWGYIGDNVEDDYYTVFAVFVADVVYPKKRNYSFDWSRFTIKEELDV